MGLEPSKVPGGARAVCSLSRDASTYAPRKVFHPVHQRFFLAACWLT